MIGIFTKLGARLDLDQSAEFELSWESPMFEDERIPAAFSTSVSFPPTQRNCTEFGYLKGFTLFPEVLEIEAYISVAGVVLSWGMLTFDGISDGKLNYTFTASALTSDLDKKIWSDNKLLPYAENATDVAALVSRIRRGYSGYSAPLLINSAFTARTILSGIAGYDPVSTNDKYHNWLDIGWFTPAVGIRSILDAFMSAHDTALHYGSTLTDLYASLAILGLYKRENVSSPEGYNKNSLYIADTLPDISFGALLESTAKLLGAAVFEDGRNWLMESWSYVLYRSAIVDWTSKVSDVYDVSVEEPQGFVIGYDGEEEQQEEAKKTTSGQTRRTSRNAFQRSFVDLYTAVDNTAYSQISHTVTKDTWSACRKTNGSSESEVLSDIIQHNIKTIKDEAAGDPFDSMINFKLPGTVVARYLEGDSWRYRLAAIVSPPELGGDRPSDVYVGIAAEGQFCDRGLAIDSSGNDVTVGEDLAPSALLSAHHGVMKDWLSRRRAVVKAELNLTPEDIVSMRLYRRYLIRGRLFVLRKLTLTLAASSDSFAARGEFVSL